MCFFHAEKIQDGISLGISAFFVYNEKYSGNSANLLVFSKKCESKFLRHRFIFVLFHLFFRKFRDEDKKGCYDEERNNEKRRNKNVA